VNVPLSHRGTDGLDQWERVKRWHLKLGQIRAALPDSEPAKSFALDIVWTFFENCYHLREWVIRAATDQKKRQLEYARRLDEAKIDRQFLDSDEFTSLLIDVLTMNAKTYEEEKSTCSAEYSSTPR
jgi:hypothetical protein